MIKYRDASGRVVMHSSKETDKRSALKKALSWEDAAKTARRGELSQAASVNVLRRLMEQSTGEELSMPTVKETLESYVENLRATGGAASTIARYRPIFIRFLAFLGDHRAKTSIASISVKDVENWRNSELAKGISAKSANMGLGIIGAALNAAKRRGEIPHNPCDAVSNLVERPDLRQPFSEAEIRNILLASRGTDWVGAVLVGVWSGLRLSDVCGLTWEQVNLTRSIINVTPEKTDREMTLPVAPELQSYFRAIVKMGSSGPIFPALAGRITGRNGGLSNEFARLMKIANVVIETGRTKKGIGRMVRTKSFHSLRHNFVSRLVNEDVPADIRKALAGHETDEAHQRYTHLDFSKQVSALGKLKPIGGWE